MRIIILGSSSSKLPRSSVHDMHIESTPSYCQFKGSFVVEEIKVGSGLEIQLRYMYHCREKFWMRDCRGYSDKRRTDE
jgi:hypothetical protein